MKKPVNIFVLAILVMFCSCSDDDTQTQALAPDVATITLDNDVFEINSSDRRYCELDGEQFTMFIHGLKFTFNKYGDFGTAEVQRSLQGFNFYYRSPFFNSSSSVSFVLESIDTVNKRVKGHVSGMLFNTNSMAIDQDMPFACDFDVKYYNKIPLVQGIHHSSEINGELWNFSNEKKEITNSPIAVTTYVSDDVNNILFTYNMLTIAQGQYDFDPASDTNKLQFAKYDPAAQQNVIYNTTGTLNVTKRENINSSVFVLTCTYNLTAVNPNNPADVVNVNNGKLKTLVYTW